MCSLFEVLANLTPSGPVVFNKTLTMEQIGQNYGFILYRTKIPSSVSGPAANISIPGLSDRGIIFVNQVCYCFVVQQRRIVRKGLFNSQGGAGMVQGCELSPLTNVAQV